MANVSRPVNLYSATDYAVLGLNNQEKPVTKPEETRPNKQKKPKKKPAPKSKPAPKKKKPAPKKTIKKLSEANRKKLLPWM